MATTAVRDWATVPDGRSSWGLPGFLQNPLKGPVGEALGDSLPTDLILMVTHYALDKLKFDTMKMIEVIKQHIPRDELERRLASYTDSDSIPGALELAESPVRTLIAHVEAYFAYESLRHVAKLTTREYLCGTEEIQRLFGLIEGIDLDHFDPTKECHTFVFGHLPWFAKNVPMLFMTPRASMAFLYTQGYTPSPVAVPGAIVIYGRPLRVEHYGNVESVNADGTAVILSKDSYGPVYRHTLGSMRVTYGRSCFFLTPPRSS